KPTSSDNLLRADLLQNWLHGWQTVILRCADKMASWRAHAMSISGNYHQFLRAPHRRRVACRRPSARRLHAKRLLALVALVPPAVVTVTSSVPVPAGDVAVILVALLMVKEVALLLPNLTAVAPVKLVPLMVTEVPPAAGPLVGEIEVTVGTAT